MYPTAKHPLFKLVEMPPYLMWTMKNPPCRLSKTGITYQSKKDLSRLSVLGDLCVICDDLLAKYIYLHCAAFWEPEYFISFYVYISSGLVRTEIELLIHLLGFEFTLS